MKLSILVCVLAATIAHAESPDTSVGCCHKDFGASSMIRVCTSQTDCTLSAAYKAKYPEVQFNWTEDAGCDNRTTCKSEYIVCCRQIVGNKVVAAERLLLPECDAREGWTSQQSVVRSDGYAHVIMNSYNPAKCSADVSVPKYGACPTSCSDSERAAEAANVDAAVQAAAAGTAIVTSRVSNGTLGNFLGYASGSGNANKCWSINPPVMDSAIKLLQAQYPDGLRCWKLGTFFSPTVVFGCELSGHVQAIRVPIESYGGNPIDAPAGSVCYDPWASGNGAPYPCQSGGSSAAVSYDSTLNCRIPMRPLRSARAVPPAALPVVAAPAPSLNTATALAPETVGTAVQAISSAVSTVVAPASAPPAADSIGVQTDVSAPVLFAIPQAPRALPPQ